jgi:hypothetical protein
MAVIVPLYSDAEQHWRHRRRVTRILSPYPPLLAVPLNLILNGPGAGARRLAAPFIEELVGLRRLLVLQAAESFLENVSSDDLEVVAFDGSFFARPAQAGSIEIRIQKEKKERPHA